MTGYALEPPAEPNLFSVSALKGKMTSVIGDIRDFPSLWAAFAASQPEIVFHLAAQPIVHTGYEQPVYTYETNVMGTVNLLECVRRAHVPVLSVVNVTTDKVYLDQQQKRGFRETDPLDGYDPYSNSKSCSELVTHSYWNSYFRNAGPAVSTARAGNVIGGGDFARDRIIPDCVRAAVSGKTLIVRNPYSIRPYQHVLEPLLAYLMIAQGQYENRTLSGWYNVGPEDRDCITTGDLADLFCRMWGNGLRWENRADTDAPHESSYLKLDCSKIKATLGWTPRWRIETAVEKTVEWTKCWLAGGDVSALMDHQIQAFLHTGI